MSEVKLSSLFKFDSKEEENDIKSSIVACRPLIRALKKVFEIKINELDKEMLERSLFDSPNWENKLVNIIAEKKALLKVISQLESLSK